MLRIIDMHVHTSQSDGTYSPEGIVHLAHKVGLKAVAITDHDTAAGVVSAQKAAQNSGLEVIPGIEISVGEGGSTHILGFYIDPTNKQLNDVINILQQRRIERNIEMIKKLDTLGFDITLDDVIKFAGTDNIGRLHISSYIEATEQSPEPRGFFKKYLAEGGLAYVHRKTVSEKEGIEAILNAGGLPFLAHICYFNLPYNEIEKNIKRLVSYGLKGIEGYYSNYTAEDEKFCDMICKKYKLLKSGGTDFHGARRRGVYLGTGRGNMCIPEDLLLPIKEALKINS